jgi:hypothetical protein
MNHNDIRSFQSASTNIFICNLVFLQQKTQGVLVVKQWYCRLLGYDILQYVYMNFGGKNCLHRKPERLFNGPVRHAGLYSVE